MPVTKGYTLWNTFTSRPTALGTAKRIRNGGHRARVVKKSKLWVVEVKYMH